MTFQWYHDGIPLPSRTNHSLALESVLATDRGLYRVEILNSVGEGWPAGRPD